MGEIKPLNTITIDELYTAWQDAFSEYIVQIDKAELEKMLHRRSYDASLSFGYFDNNRLVSFILNGIGEFRGQKTAYDTGTGTVKSHRKQGLVGTIFNKALPYLKQEGVQQCLLEVLQNNTTAISVYQKLGFNISREFNYYIVDPKTEIIANFEDDYELKELPLETILNHTHWYDFEPSWQNNNTALLQNPNDFVLLAACKNNTVYGYGVVEVKSGDIPQLVVDKQYRREGIGIVIFAELLKKTPLNKIKILNTETTCAGVKAFFEYIGWSVSGKQYEMIKQLG